MMQEIEIVATFVAKVLIYCGGLAFLICFFFGAKLLWEMFKLTIYTSKLINKWSNYKKIPVEGREAADKSGHFDDDTKNIK
jgi:hypothetical protein